MTLAPEKESLFEVYVGNGPRTRTTIRETRAEFRRYANLSKDHGELPLVAGSLLAVYAELVEGLGQIATTPSLTERVSEYYVSEYGEQPPYNWTDVSANSLDMTSTPQPAGP